MCNRSISGVSTGFSCGGGGQNDRQDRETPTRQSVGDPSFLPNARRHFRGSITEQIELKDRFHDPRFFATAALLAAAIIPAAHAAAPKEVVVAGGRSRPCHPGRSIHPENALEGAAAQTCSPILTPPGPDQGAHEQMVVYRAWYWPARGTRKDGASRNRRNLSGRGPQSHTCLMRLTQIQAGGAQIQPCASTPAAFSKARNLELQEISRRFNGLPAVRIDRKSGWENPVSVRGLHPDGGVEIPPLADWQHVIR